MLSVLVSRARYMSYGETGMAYKISLKPWLCTIAMFCSTTLAQPATDPDKPDFVYGEVVVTRYDAASGSDLLTGGLGMEGLRGAPPYLPAVPTAEQLRTAVI